jgi:4-amino-4-deoxy-L-arabinose transferase-like glycosyltransferase
MALIDLAAHQSLARGFHRGAKNVRTAVWAGSLSLALLILAIWLLLTPGLRPLLLPDEGRYATVALEMLTRGSLIPTLNGLPFFHKPPLFYWIDMAAMSVFGVGEFSARAGSIVGAWIMGAATLLFVRRFHDRRTAFLALGILATSPFYFVGAQYANHDMLVAGLISAAILTLARAVEHSQKVDLRWLIAGAMFCALATLAKGLIGFVLPALVVGPWLLLRGRWRQLLGLLHPAACLAFLIVAAPWFIAMQWQFPGFSDYFFMEQHFRRFVQSSFNNIQPLWFYVPVLPALMLPWSAWIPHALRLAWQRRDAQIGLYVWWIVAVVGFFSLPSSKLVGYVLPAVVPLCILVALTMARGSDRRNIMWVVGAAVACVALVGAIAWQAPKSNLALARVLEKQIAPGDKVVMIDAYLYDVPFYAGLIQPVVFYSDWRDGELANQDSWRNELVDAARFDPELGARVLQPIDRLDRATCTGSVAWYAIKPGQVKIVAQLAGAHKIFGDSNGELWRAPARTCG